MCTRTKLTFLLLLFFAFGSSVHAQNIFSALQASQEREYKTKRPKKIIETNTFFSSSGKKVDKNIKIFDDAGMLLTEERFNSEGKMTARLSYDNDTTLRLNRSRVFERWTAAGYSKETAYYTYNKDKCLFNVTDKDASGNVIGQTHLACNERGLPVELTTFDGRGNAYGKETAEYLYDKNKAVSMIWSNDGRRLTSDTIKISFQDAYRFPWENEVYNEKGDLLSHTRRNLDGSLTYFEEEYIYDQYGNITENKIYKVTVSGNGKKKRTTDRIFRKEYIY